MASDEELKHEEHKAKEEAERAEREAHEAQEHAEAAAEDKANDAAKTATDAVNVLGEGLRKVFLAGVGALAATGEKSQEIINDLVKKGELTVAQGKQLNTELKHKADSTGDDIKDKAAAAMASASDAAKSVKQAVKAQVEDAKNVATDAFSGLAKNANDALQHDDKKSE